MKVEKSFSIDGKIVEKEFQKGDISAYFYFEDDSEMTIFFVNNKTELVLFKQTITADCNQNFGVISSVNFEGC